MLVPLDRGPCVSSRPFAYFFLKCAPLPHKTISPQSQSFVVVPFSETPIEDSAFSPFATLLSFLRGAQTSDPCRGFGSPRPALRLSCFPRGLQSATPVEDSALLLHRLFFFILAKASHERPLSRMRPSPLNLPWLCSLHPRLQSGTPVLTCGESCLPSGRFLPWDPPCTPSGLQRSSALHVCVVSSRHWAGELGMGRTGSSVD